MMKLQETQWNCRHGNDKSSGLRLLLETLVRAGGSDLSASGRAARSTAGDNSERGIA